MLIVSAAQKNESVARLGHLFHDHRGSLGYLGFVLFLAKLRQPLLDLRLLFADVLAIELPQVGLLRFGPRIGGDRENLLHIRRNRVGAERALGIGGRNPGKWPS